MNRKHGEVNYYLTQMLSDHGCFRAYLHRFNHDDSPDCPAGCGVPESAEHVFFRCPFFKEARRELELKLGATPDPDSLINLMLTEEENWDAVNDFATIVMKKLREEEVKRRRAKTSMATPATRKGRITDFLE